MRAIRLYPIPGRRVEFEERLARAKHWLLMNAASSAEERAMQLNGLASAGATAPRETETVARDITKAAVAASMRRGNFIGEIDRRICRDKCKPRHPFPF